MLKWKIINLNRGMEPHSYSRGALYCTKIYNNLFQVCIKKIQFIYKTYISEIASLVTIYTPHLTVTKSWTVAAGPHECLSLKLWNVVHQSLKITGNGTILKRGYSFLFAFHNNYGCIFSHFDTTHKHETPSQTLHGSMNRAMQPHQAAVMS